MQSYIKDAHIRISEGKQLILMAFIPVYCIAESIGIGRTFSGFAMKGI